jgi:transposase
MRADPVLIKALFRTLRWKCLPEGGRYTSLSELAAAERIDRSYLGKMLRLTLLAPDIIDAVLDGRPPPPLPRLRELHACVDGAGRILRLLASPGHHGDLRYAMVLLAGIPARDAALDRAYVSAALRAALAVQGCAIHTPPKRGMAAPPPWDKAIYARRHLIENRFASLKDWTRIALRREKTRRRWMGFVPLAAAVLNLRIAQSGHRP